jgi:nicotinic acid phosphoribosyltransferase
MQNKFFHWLKHYFSSKITIRGMKEGEIVFASETSSLTLDPQIYQMLETPFINLLGFATHVATNANRCSTLSMERSVQTA